MRILSRYVLREFLVPVAYCLVAFTALHLIFELFGEFDKIISAKPPAGILLRYIGGYLAKDMQWLITPALLLGGLYSMWQLARHGEITAMRANGIGFVSITAPILCAACVFSVLTWLCGEFYAPKAIKDADAIKESGFRKATARVLADFHFNNVVDRRDWQAASFDTARNGLKEVKISWTDDDGYIFRTLSADRAVWNGDSWWFLGANITDFIHQPGASSLVASRRTERSFLVMPELKETPRDFEIEYVMQGNNPSAESLSSGDIRRYLALRPNLAGSDRRAWIYEMFNRHATPLACIFITLFAIPAGLATGRQSVFAGVVTAILLFIGYYALSLVCGVMAKNGSLPVWFGIFAPNAAIFCAGLWIFRRQR